MYSVIVSFGVISLLFPFFIVKGLFGAYATPGCGNESNDGLPGEILFDQF